MPSRRSDRGNKLKQQPGESDLALTNRKAMTAVTLAPLFGLQGLGILAGASALHTGASAESQVKDKPVTVESKTSGDTIEQLTDSILQSAAGRPFAFSITDKKEKQKAAREALKMMMINGILSPEVTSEFDLSQQLNQLENDVNVDKAGKKGNPKTVHPETQRANKKAQSKSAT